MDGILIKFQSPDWWFTGIFFILLGLLIRFVLRKIPGILKKLFRNSNAKTLKKIKKQRWSQYEIQFQIAVERSYFMVFILSCFAYIILLVASPLAQIFIENTLLGMLLATPAYIAEIFWLNKSTYVSRLIFYANKVV